MGQRQVGRWVNSASAITTVEACDGLLSGLARAFLLFGFVGDDDGTATDTAARHAAGCLARDVKTAITVLDAG